jgi:hypothetical protein
MGGYLPIMTTDGDNDEASSQAGGVRDTQGNAATLRQVLHAATGDRDGEAAALLDRDATHGNIDDAREAIARVNRESTGSTRDTDSEIASPGDVASVQGDDDHHTG